MRYIVLVWLATTLLTTLNLYAVKAHGLPPLLALALTGFQIWLAVVVLMGAPVALHAVKVWASRTYFVISLSIALPFKREEPRNDRRKSSCGSAPR